MARLITKEDHIKMMHFNCDKGKHRYRLNRYGIVWCVICGNLSINNQGKVEPLQENDKLVIDCTV